MKGEVGEKEGRIYLHQMLLLEVFQLRISFVVEQL
jgi:hypothetical protein